MTDALLLVDVLPTAVDGLRHGFEVTIAAGACSTVDLEQERIALGYLAKVLGVEVV